MEKQTVTLKEKLEKAWAIAVGAFLVWLFIACGGGNLISNLCRQLQWMMTH